MYARAILSISIYAVLATANPHFSFQKARLTRHEHSIDAQQQIEHHDLRARGSNEYLLQKEDLFDILIQKRDGHGVKEGEILGEFDRPAASPPSQDWTGFRNHGRYARMYKRAPRRGKPSTGAPSVGPTSKNAVSAAKPNIRNSETRNSKTAKSDASKSETAKGQHGPMSNQFGTQAGSMAAKSNITPSGKVLGKPAASRDIPGSKKPVQSNTNSNTAAKKGTSKGTISRGDTKQTTSQTLPKSQSKPTNPDTQSLTSGGNSPSTGQRRTPGYAKSTESSRAKEKPKSTAENVPAGNRSNGRLESKKPSDGGKKINRLCKRAGNSDSSYCPSSESSSSSESAPERQRTRRPATTEQQGSVDSGQSTNTNVQVHPSDETEDTATSQSRPDAKRHASQSSTANESPPQKKPALSVTNDNKPTKPHKPGEGGPNSPSQGGPIPLERGSNVQSSNPDEQSHFQWKSQPTDIKADQSDHERAKMLQSTSEGLSEHLRQPGVPANEKKIGDLSFAIRPSSDGNTDTVVAGTSARQKKRKTPMTLNDAGEEVMAATGGKGAPTHGEMNTNAALNKKVGLPPINPDGKPGVVYSVNVTPAPYSSVPQRTCHQCKLTNEATGFCDGCNTANEQTIPKHRAKIAAEPTDERKSAKQLEIFENVMAESKPKTDQEGNQNARRAVLLRRALDTYIMKRRSPHDQVLHKRALGQPQAQNMHIAAKHILLRQYLSI